MNHLSCPRQPVSEVLLAVTDKGVTGGPSREGPGVGHTIVSDTKQMTKERKKKEKNEWEKEKMCKEKKMDERETEKWTELSSKR